MILHFNYFSLNRLFTRCCLLDTVQWTVFGELFEDLTLFKSDSC